MNKILNELSEVFLNTFNSVAKFEKNMVNKYRRYNLSINEVHTLEEISRKENSSLVKIANALNITPPSVTVAIKKLEKKEMLIKIKNSNDNRSSVVILTELGKKIVRTHEWFHRNMLNKISHELDEEELVILTKGLYAVDKYLEKF